jgi:hypothetical protein
MRKILNDEAREAIHSGHVQRRGQVECSQIASRNENAARRKFDERRRLLI